MTRSANCCAGIGVPGKGSSLGNSGDGRAGILVILGWGWSMTY